MTLWVKKDDSGSDSEAINGPAASWRKLPEQGNKFAKKKMTKSHAGGQNLGEVQQQAYRMVQTEQEVYLPEGPIPLYPSQKPDGNKDTLFSRNVNENPPNVIPPDPEGYLLW